MNEKKRTPHLNWFHIGSTLLYCLVCFFRCILLMAIKRISVIVIKKLGKEG